jgi:hypothetical protein
MNDKLYAVFRMVSDQYGTTELVGVYSTRARAQAVVDAQKVPAAIRELTIDFDGPSVPPPRGYRGSW